MSNSVQNQFWDRQGLTPLRCSKAVPPSEEGGIRTYLFAGLELINSDSKIQNTVFRGHTADYFWGQCSVGLMMRNSAPIFEKADFRSNNYGIYVESGECPDLSGVTFGSGENANSVDIFPSNCAS